MCLYVCVCVSVYAQCFVEQQFKVKITILTISCGVTATNLYWLYISCHQLSIYEEVSLLFVIVPIIILKYVLLYYQLNVIKQKKILLLTFFMVRIIVCFNFRKAHFNTKHVRSDDICRWRFDVVAYNSLKWRQHCRRHINKPFELLKYIKKYCCIHYH